MNLYKYLFFILFIFFFLAFILELSSFSDGPPPSRTAAPGELNCSDGYCHNNFALNSGPGMAKLSGEVIDKGFKPGQTYTITAQINQTNMQRFGFMVLAYDSISQVSSGTLALSEPERTQITENQAGDRFYVTHDPANIAPDSSLWTFEWTAPDSVSDSTQISFYAAFVAANNNNNSAGDYVYAIQTNLEVDNSNTTSIRNELSEEQVQVRFDPTNHRIIIESEEMSKYPTQVEVLSITGQSIFKDYAQLSPIASISVPTNSWLSGIYLLKLQQGKQHRVQKFRYLR